MKVLQLYLLAGLLFAFAFAPPAHKEVTLHCTVQNCEKVDSLYLFEFDGITFSPMQSTPIEENTAAFKLPKTDPRFYYVGLAANNLRPIIIGSEEQVALEGECKGFRNAKIKSSELNAEYEQLKYKLAAFGSETTALVKEMQKAKTPEKQQFVAQRFADVDKRKMEYYKNLKKENPYLAKVLAFNLYLSYQNNGDKYNSEIAYFANEYFQFVNWKDDDLNYLPWVFESLKNFTTTLSSVGLEATQQREYLEGVLDNIPASSRTYKLALGGILAGLESKRQSNYSHFGKLAIEKYKDEDPRAMAAIELKIKSMTAMTPGGEAPDFTQTRPDGTALSLSDLRGKVVLIDFWASWCGPCRRENPNVVKAYNKYKDKGFDILGVSLDTKKDRWLKAIEQDGLIWHHVSDLRGWSNEVAKLYGVRSIPHTVLLDMDGKIIARNLRGRQLEQQLEKIFKD